MWPCATSSEEEEEEEGDEEEDNYGTFKNHYSSEPAPKKGTNLKIRLTLFKNLTN